MSDKRIEYQVQIKARETEDGEVKMVAFTIHSPDKTVEAKLFEGVQGFTREGFEQLFKMMGYVAAQAMIVQKDEQFKEGLARLFTNSVNEAYDMYDKDRDKMEYRITKAKDI